MWNKTYKCVDIKSIEHLKIDHEIVVFYWLNNVLQIHTDTIYTTHIYLSGKGVQYKKKA